MKRLASAAMSMLSSSPTPQDWIDLNESFRHGVCCSDDESTCFRDARCTLRSILSGGVEAILMGQRSQALLECLSRRVLRTCHDELGLCRITGLLFKQFELYVLVTIETD